MKINEVNKTLQILEVENFWPLEFCISFIESMEKIGFTSIKYERNKDRTRYNQMLRFENDEISKVIFDGLRKALKGKIYNQKFISVHESIRIYKYEKTDEFKRHIDMGIKIAHNIQSKYSILLYLNDKFTGGNTSFGKMKIKPKMGSLILFPHNLKHSGQKINSGTKYILRTDLIMLD
jgi:prolyl 4-hydroxylase